MKTKKKMSTGASHPPYGGMDDVRPVKAPAKMPVKAPATKMPVKPMAKPGAMFNKFQLKKKNWIAGAIKKPGALHKELGVPAGKKIPAKKLEKATKAGGIEAKRANLAKTLKSFKHKTMTQKQDNAYDKKHGQKEGSKKDIAQDKKFGIKDKK